MRATGGYLAVQEHLTGIQAQFRPTAWRDHTGGWLARALAVHSQGGPAGGPGPADPGRPLASRSPRGSGARVLLDQLPGLDTVRA